MKVAINLIKGFVFLLVWLSLCECDSKNSSNHFVGYEKFKCKGKTITSYYPMKLYTFKNKYNEDFYSKMTQYSMEPVEFSTNLHSDGNINVVKLYPSFEKFKLLKYYVHCSFGNGCYHDYLVRHQNGVIAWLSGANFSSNTCQISGSDFWLDMEQNATDSYDANKIDIPYPQNPIKNNTSYHLYYKSKTFIERYIQQNNMKEEVKADNLTIILPSKEIYQLSVLIYVEKILKHFYPKNKRIYMKLLFENISHPIFEYSINNNTYLKTPFNCKKISIQSPFGCFKEFDKWLEKPYKCNITECIGNTKYDFKKNKLHLFAIFNYKFLDIGMYFDYMRYLKVLKDSKIKIYSAEIGYKGFWKEGIYLVDNNYTVTNELYFNKESTDKLLNMKDSIEKIK